MTREKLEKMAENLKMVEKDLENEVEAVLVDNPLSYTVFSLHHYPSYIISGLRSLLSPR